MLHRHRVIFVKGDPRQAKSRRNKSNFHGSQESAIACAGYRIAVLTSLCPMVFITAARLPVSHRIRVPFSITIKGLFIVLALVGWATLLMAVAADMGASLVVIGNGLRALRTRPD